MKKIALIVIVIVTLVFTAAPGFPASIKQSKHDLSSGVLKGSSGTGTAAQVCIFCHTSHVEKSLVPMWNREDSNVIYTLYDSSTLYSTPDQPDGASKLCLSCHDGTIALGKVIKKGKGMGMLKTGLGRIPPASKANLGSDLSDDHPISFDPSLAVSASPQLIHPPPFDKIKYDSNGKIQCTTCHNPHHNIYTKFLVKSGQNGAICKSCHRLPAYSGISTHDISPQTWNGKNENPWPHTDMRTVMDNSCMNCHRSHGAEGKERLLNALEENVCLVCHNGNVGQNIESLLVRTSGHRVNAYQGSHDPMENILTVPVHVECVDCHNPHRVNRSQAHAPNVSGRLAGVSGMSITGTLKAAAQFEYEVCLKCHGQDRYRVTGAIKRMVDTSNIRAAINPTNASYHAVAAQGKGRWVPSLRPPYTISSRIYCRDCHNSDSSAQAGGAGPDGPHGSRYEYILERQYVTSDYTHWSEANYALCYKCHNPISLFDDKLSGFEKHEKHVREEDTPCSVCHDPHGSPGSIGLVNFDTAVAFPNAAGLLKFEVIGNKGYCYMQCHGSHHGPKEYRRK